MKNENRMGTRSFLEKQNSKLSTTALSKGAIQITLALGIGTSSKTKDSRIPLLLHYIVKVHICLYDNDRRKKKREGFLDSLENQKEEEGNEYASSYLKLIDKLHR